MTEHMTRPEQRRDHGQSPWLATISRALPRDGTVQALLDRGIHRAGAGDRGRRASRRRRRPVTRCGSPWRGEPALIDRDDPAWLVATRTRPLAASMFTD